MANKWLNTTVKTYTDSFGVTKSPLVYDAGSRDGHDGVELAERISDGQIEWSNIVLFECNPPSIETIKRNYPQATLITEAILDVSGKTLDFMQIHGDQNYVGSSTLNTKRNNSWIKETSIVHVKTKRLDEVIEELGHQDTEINIMKIDIEGYSYEALVSLGKYLRNVRVFHIETEPEGKARAENSSDIALFMTQKGYKLMAVENEWGDEINDHVYLRIDK